MLKHKWRIAQGALGLVILYFLVIKVIKNWDDFKAQQIQWHFRWEFIIASLLVTWVMYGFLILGWRSVLHGWRQWIRAVDAARIWCLSSLGKYIPGKVWAIAGMAVMAQREGVSGAAATGSAIIMQLVSIATGTILTFALIGTRLLDEMWPGSSLAALALAIVALLAVLALTSPSLTRRIGFVVGRPDAVQPVEPESLAAALFTNFLAWAGYGLALQLLLLGTIENVTLDWATATGAFAASYLVGYLALIVPGGIGVRELVLVLLLKPTIGLGPAGALAVASRLTLTVNELGAALPFLFWRPAKVAAATTNG
ncbi:MAG: lysylphosphatidylglycerol synthase domain-containing protein [Gemmatimonadota bacterium]